MSPRTSSLCRRRCSTSNPCSTSTVARWRLDHSHQAVDHAERSFDVGTLAGRGLAGQHVGGQPAFGLGQLLLEQLLALVQAGVAHFELGAARRERRRPTIEFGPQLTAGAGRVDLGLFVRLETGQQRRQLVDPTLLTFDRGTPFVQRGDETVVFGAQLAESPVAPVPDPRTRR